ncbi:MAG: hypothetical protein HGA35_05430, partial [Erysipelotrichaceae bacterium]|nr:hypothetical protein [Erysipelotrichaceae bacterium]
EKEEEKKILKELTVFVRGSSEALEIDLEVMAEMDLYVVDYSFPVRHLEEYISVFKSILVLDHHKTAIDEYTERYEVKEGGFDWMFIRPSDNCQIVFSHTESGAKLSWMYFHGGYAEVPDYIELISDRDLWTFKLENSRKFYYGLKLQDLSTFNMIDTLLNSFKNNIIVEGSKYEKVLANRNTKIAKANAIEISIKIAGKDYKGVLVNSYLDIASDLCNHLIAEKGYDIAIVYNIHNDSVGCSLRSKKGLDSSPVSLMYGGGGHAQASGFSIPFQELNSIITDRFIIVHKKVSFLQRLKGLFK